MKSPKNAITRHDITALQHLDIWKRFALNWCEHKPSITVSVRENEWVEVGAWVYKNFNILSGVSFLPHADDDHSYELAPYEDCSPETYRKLAKTLPAEIDWNSVKEEDDQTTASQEFACMAGACEI